MDKGLNSEKLNIENKEIASLKYEKENRAIELIDAYKEIALQIEDKGKRAAELAIANIELIFQNEEKEKRASELIVANHELIFQNQEKQKRAEELTRANDELQKAEAAIRQLNSELELKVIKRSAQYAFLSQINQTIVHVKDAKTLFRNVCLIALKYGKFKIAWIGNFDNEHKQITLLDHSGIPSEDINLFIDTPYVDNSPQNQVLRTGKYFVSNDIENTHELDNYKSFAVKNNIRSCILLPIKKSGITIGTFNLYTSELNFFDDLNLKMALEATSDISFALDLFDKADRQKEAEVIILKNEHLFRALIEKSTDMETLATVDGKLFYASPSISKVLGYKMEDFLSTPVTEIIHPDDISFVFEKVQMILLTPGDSFDSQHRLRHKTGYYIWCEGTMTNMLHEPYVNAIVSNFRDISDKKSIEIQQEFESNNLTALINNTSDLMWSVDRNFNLITSNQPFNEVCKVNFGKVIAKGENILSESYPPEVVTYYKRLYERALGGESFTEITHSKVLIESWTVVSYYPIRRGDEIIGTACHSRDITEIKKTEQQLNESEAFNRGVLNSLSSLIAVIDVSGNIVSVNESWKTVAKENGDTTLKNTSEGTNYFSVCKKAAEAGDKIAHKILLGMKSILDQQDKFFYIEYPCHSPNKNTWFGMRAMRFDSDVPMIVLVHTNITERKLAEEEREKLIKDTIQRSRDLEQFTFIISHNLRAPTANLIGLAEILQDKTLTQEVQQELLEGLLTSAIGLDSVIKDINFILQVKQEVNDQKELISFQQLVDDILFSNRNLIDKHQVQIKTNFSEVNEIFSLKVYLHSIFFNLISNSIKYCKPDEPPIIEIKSQKYEGKVILTFKDNGMGWDMKTIGDKVFGLYKRFHTHVEGKGMGLFMIKTQVEAIGGAISVSSELNQGTEFTIVFKNNIS